MDSVSSSSVSSTESDSGSMVSDCEDTQPYLFESYGIHYKTRTGKLLILLLLAYCWKKGVLSDREFL